MDAPVCAICLEPCPAAMEPYPCARCRVAVHEGCWNDYRRTAATVRCLYCHDAIEERLKPDRDEAVRAHPNPVFLYVYLLGTVLFWCMFFFLLVHVADGDVHSPHAGTLLLRVVFMGALASIIAGYLWTLRTISVQDARLARDPRLDALLADGGRYQTLE